MPSLLNPIKNLFATRCIGFTNTDDPAVQGELRYEYEVAAPQAGLTSRNKQAQRNES